MKVNDLNEIEVRVVSELLTKSSDNVSQGLEKFTTWLGVSLSAVIVLVVSNIDKVAKHFDLTQIKISIYLLLFTILLLIIQKYLSFWAKSMILMIQLGAELDQKYSSDRHVINTEKLYDVIEDSYVWYLKWLYKKQRANKNSYLPRTVFKLSTVQGTIVLTQLILVLISLSFIAFGLQTS